MIGTDVRIEFGTLKTVMFWKTYKTKRLQDFISLEKIIHNFINLFHMSLMQFILYAFMSMVYRFFRRVYIIHKCLFYWVFMFTCAHPHIQQIQRTLF